MNEIKVITEMCPEDRARLDKQTAAIEELTKALGEYPHKCENCAAYVADVLARVQAGGEKMVSHYEPAEEPKNEPQEPAKVETPATTPNEEEKPAEVTETPAEEPAEPSVTLAQIQQKVVQLCAAFDGTKKADVRAIINEYGAKVSDLKDQPDKWDEVWTKLTALEG